MPQLWNRYSSTYQEVKGGIPVWVVVPEKRVSGGMLKNSIRDMEVLASGSPQEFNFHTHESKILKCFEIISPKHLMLTQSFQLREQHALQWFTRG